MKKIIFIIYFMLHLASVVFSQDQDTSKSVISSSSSSEQFKVDSLVKQEQSPLDIGKDRGIYIVTSDGKMQLRILGSVRFSALYDIVELSKKRTFNTYDIPTGEENVKIPNYYNTLNESRIGFEITRKLKTENVFIRLESDFNGANGQFRIRQAYGQIGNFLVGQTWSLFSNVSSMPSTVDINGPTGSVTLWTPQIRYGGLSKRGMSWLVALEYSKPDLSIENFDTSGVSTVQLIPDITGRFVWEGALGIVQLSAVLTTISSKDANNKVSSTFGYGGSLSGTVNFNDEHKVLYQFTYGKAISHYISTFSGTGNDAVYNPKTEEFEGITAFGGFLSYGVEPRLLNSQTSISVGYARLYDEKFIPEDYFQNSFSVALDTFWNITEGARLGAEFVYGQRWNKNGETGHAARISTLFYYDF